MTLIFNIKTYITKKNTKKVKQNESNKHRIISELKHGRYLEYSASASDEPLRLILNRDRWIL